MPYYRGRGVGPGAWVLLVAAAWATLVLRRLAEGRDRTRRTAACDTGPAFTLDTFSARRQREIAHVVERLAAFAPTKVAIEPGSEYQGEIDRYYEAYRAGRLDDVPGRWLTASNEILQLGFRLAQRLGHPRVHCAGATDRHYEPRPDPVAHARAHGQAHLLDRWRPRFFAWWDHGDARMAERSLAEILLDMNTHASAMRGHGLYLVDAFRVGGPVDYPGADRVTAWCNRNLRIFANLQRITERPDERLLLVVGAAHLAILRHCVEASPEYDLIEAGEFLTP